MLPITSAESGIRRFDKCQIGTTAIGWAKVCGTSAAWQFCARGRWLGRLLPTTLKRIVRSGADVDWRADLTMVSHRNRFEKTHHRTKRTWSRLSRTSSPAQLLIKIKLKLRADRLVIGCGTSKIAFGSHSGAIMARLLRIMVGRRLNCVIYANDP